MMQGTVTRAISTRLLPGGPLRDKLVAQVAKVVAELGVPVRLCIVQVGEDAASSAYIKRKQAACAEAGIEAEVVRFPAERGEEDLHRMLHDLAADAEVQGIIVQTPLPRGWRVQAALDVVPPEKDVDGLSLASAALRRAKDRRALLPATPLGVMRLLRHAGVVLDGAKIAVIGKGMVVGAPLQDMLADEGALVVGIDKDTANPAVLAKACDVVVAAAGAPGLVTDDWIKPGAVVIDVGLTRVDGKLRGDVAKERVAAVAAVLTPVPGGVGPMTVASILTNIADAACLQVGRPRPEWVIDGADDA